MKHIALMLVVAVAIGAAPAPKATNRDFDQLMEAAVTASLANAGLPGQTICVQRELESPLKFSRGAMVATHVSGVPGMPAGKLPAAQQSTVEKAFRAALSLKSAFPARTAISSLPPKFVLYSAAAVPARCVIDHRWASASPNEAITLTLTRPVLADGFAFIDQTTGCAGLCGSGWLRIFRKRNGKWTQVAYRNLFVS